MQGANLVVIQEYGSRVEADLAKCMLEDAGIEAMSQADTAGGMREHLAWSGAGFKILVREEDAAVARELLARPAEGGEMFNADLESDDDSQSPWRRFT
jgi:Putative prokaryotic signal transducing protein